MSSRVLGKSCRSLGRSAKLQSSKSRPLASIASAEIPLGIPKATWFPYKDRYAEVIKTKKDNKSCSGTSGTLGMGGNPGVSKTMHDALDRYGACSSGSRNISGHDCFAISLEKTLARLHEESALYFIQDNLINALVSIWERLGLRRLDEWARDESDAVAEGWETTGLEAPVWNNGAVGASGRGSEASGTV